MNEKIKLDGVEVEVPSTVAQLVAKERANASAMLDAVKADAATHKAAADKATARADAAEAKAADVQAKLDAATKPEAVAALVAGRVALEGAARKVLGAEVKLDGLSDAEIKAQVLAKARPSIKLDGKSADYVDALFDATIAEAPAINPATAEAARKIEQAPKLDGVPQDPETKLRAHIAGMWQGSK